MAALAVVALAPALSGCGGAAPRHHDDLRPAPLPPSRGATFYVAPTGSDDAAGTRQAPWRTVQKAFDTLRPGQTALVRGGTYRENLVVDRGGRPDAPITVRSAPGERAVLEPAVHAPSYPLRLTTGAAYVRIQGFVIQDARGPSTMNVVGLGEDPGAHDYEISDCEIRFARNSSGVFVDNTNRHVWLLGNTVHDNNEPGVQHQGIYFEGHDSVIANNVVYGQTDGFGIQIRAGARNVEVTNNTVTRVSLSGIMVESTASDVTVVNNVSAFNGGWAVRGLDGGGPLGTGNVAYGNLGFGNRSGEFANEGRPIIDFSRGGNVVADPRFADAAAGDFRLAAGSPALARALPAFTPAHDRAGDARPVSGRADLGAFERSG
jgi:hypothetical protein